MSEGNYWAGGNRVSRRAVLRGAAWGGVGLAASALIGCSSKTDSKGAAPGANAPSGTTAAAAVQGKSGGRLARAISNDPDTLDLHSSETSATMTPAAPLYNHLVQFDPMKVGDTPADIIPDLATSWEVAPDGMTYTFKLVQNAKFHDGTPFTSADVKASIERQQKPPDDLKIAPRSGMLQVIKSVETPDPYTVRLLTKQPTSPLSMLPMMGQGWMAIYSKKDIEAKFDYKAKGNGTGPFREIKINRGSNTTLQKNKEYHVKGRPFLDGLDLFNMPQESARDAALQAGQLHIGSANPATLGPLKSALGDKANYFERPDLVFDMLSFNTTKAPWKDERVRLAFARAINRDDAIAVVMKGAGIAGGYMRSGGGWDVPLADIRKVPGYEPFGANTIADSKKLLMAAGVPEGFKVPLLIRQTVSENQGLFAADQLAKIGVTVTQDVQQSAVAYQRLNKGEFDLVVFGLTTALDDPDAVYSQYHLQDAPGNYTKLSSPQLEELFKKQTVELDPAKRKDLVRQMELTALPLLAKVVFYWKVSNAIAHKSVKSWTLHARTGDYNNSRFQDVWLDA